MKTWMYFPGFGQLLVLWTEDYYDGDFSYISSAKGEDGKMYSIVRDNKTLQYRYTII